MPDERNEQNENCDRVFGARLNYLEAEVKEMKAELKVLNERDTSDTNLVKTRLALAERDIKWWGTLAGLFGGFGFELVSKFFK